MPDTSSIFFNAPFRTVAFAGKKARLTGRMTEIFAVFHANIGQVVSRAKLFNEIYAPLHEADWPETDKTIDVQICKLRRALPPGVRLETIWGSGWRLRLPEGLGPPKAEAALQAVATPATAAVG